MVYRIPSLARGGSVRLRQCGAGMTKSSGGPKRAPRDRDRAGKRCRRPGLGRANHCPLAAIYLNEWDGLVRDLRRKVGDEHALDIAQDVFLRVAASQTASQLQNPGGYLNRIARNILIDRARRRRCRIDPLPLVEALDAPFEAEQEHGLEAGDLRAVLDTALGELSAKTRRVFVMHRFEGLAYREIHSRLGISLATVEYHMMKALSHIRNAVEASR